MNENLKYLIFFLGILNAVTFVTMELKMDPGWPFACVFIGSICILIPGIMWLFEQNAFFESPTNNDEKFQKIWKEIESKDWLNSAMIEARHDIAHLQSRTTNLVNDFDVLTNNFDSLQKQVESLKHVTALKKL